MDKEDILSPKDSPHLFSRLLLVVLCVTAGLIYRASVSFLPTGIFRVGFLLCFSALLLSIALLMRKQQSLHKYWEIPYVFFVFTIAGIGGDAMASPIQHIFVQNVLRQTYNIQNPLASTVMGTVLVQLVATLLLVIPIMLLTKLSGNGLTTIFIDKSKKLWPLSIGVIGFLFFYFYTASGRAYNLFPNHGITHSQFFALTPALIVLVLLNGFREELWFRGLFLKKYGKFLSPLSSNILTAVIFTSFHVQVQYSRSLLLFLGIAFIQALVLGYLMQKSGSILASLLFHAGLDIPIFLVYLSYVVK